MQPAAQPVAVAATGGAPPSTVVAYLLWFLLGFLGVHHLYIGRGIGVFLLALITGQAFGLWWILDAFLIPGSIAKNHGGAQVIVVQG